NLLALLLLAEIWFAAHFPYAGAGTFLDASALLHDALGDSRLLPARLALLAGGPLYPSGSAVRGRSWHARRLLCPNRCQSEQTYRKLNANRSTIMHRCIDLPHHAS